MTAGDATTGGFTAAHVDKLHGAAEKANKIMQKHSDALHDAADTITSLVAGTSPKGSHAGGREAKEGRALSSANSQALSDHADALNDLADSTTKSMNRQTKSINSVADDLARVLQGSEAAYGTDPGDAGDAQEGKDSRQRSSYQPRTPAPTPRSSDTDTASEDELAFAMLKLSGLRTA